jgi:hypothetical protein
MAVSHAKDSGGKMKKGMKAKWVLILGLSLVSCSKHSQVQPTSALPPAPANSVPNTPPAATETTAKATEGTKTEMRNVMFRLMPNAAAHLQVLTGELWPAGKHTVVEFDDKNSFEVRVSNGTVSISPEALSEIMNKHVFARPDAPLKNLTVTIDNNRLIIKGKLHNKGDIPFATAGTLNVTSDGRMRVHTEKITAMKLPLKGVMGLFGIELAKIVNTSKIDGIDTDKNDLLMDLGKLLPAPHIRGKLTGVRIDRDAIVTTFGDGGRSLPPPKEKTGYMTFAGSTVRFGSMEMSPADLTVVDIDTGGPLDWNQDHYKEQLVAGYSKITPSFGLRAYVKGYNKLGRSTANSSAKPPGY